MGVPIIFPFFYLTLVKKILLIPANLEEFPACSSLSEAEKSTAHIEIACEKVELQETLGSSVDFLAFEVHLSDELSIIVDLFEDSFFPSVEELPDCAFYPSDGNLVGSRGVINLKE